MKEWKGIQLCKHPEWSDLLIDVLKVTEHIIRLSEKEGNQNRVVVISFSIVSCVSDSDVSLQAVISPWSRDDLWVWQATAGERTRHNRDWKWSQDLYGRSYGNSQNHFMLGRWIPPGPTTTVLPPTTVLHEKSAGYRASPGTDPSMTEPRVGQPHQLPECYNRKIETSKKANSQKKFVYSPATGDPSSSHKARHPGKNQKLLICNAHPEAFASAGRRGSGTSSVF